MRGPEGGKGCKRFVKTGVSGGNVGGGLYGIAVGGELESALF